MSLSMTPHAIRIRTILDLHAALLLTADDVAPALTTMPINVPTRYVSTPDTAAVTSYAADLLDLDQRIRYLAYGPDAVDAYLTEEELAASLKYHHGDKDALRDRMLMDLFAQLDALIRESAPPAEPLTPRPPTVGERLLPRFLEELTAAEDRVASLEATARDVVTDYAPTSCDDLDRCACSMGRLYRLLTGVSLEAPVGGLG